MKKIHKKIIRLQANALTKHAKAYARRTPGPLEDFEYIDDYRHVKSFTINRTMVMGMVPSWSDHKKARMIRMVVRQENTFLEDTGLGLQIVLFYYEPNKAIIDAELKRLAPKRRQRLLVRPKRYKHVFDAQAVYETLDPEKEKEIWKAINSSVSMLWPTR